MFGNAPWRAAAATIRTPAATSPARHVDRKFIAPPAGLHYQRLPRPTCPRAASAEVSMSRVRFALRTLFKTPFVTVVAIVSLALGIGANTAIFSLFDQVLLRPLPVRDPAQLVTLSSAGPKPGSNSCTQEGDNCDSVFSFPMFRDLEVDHSAFIGLAAHRAFGASLAYRGQTSTA